MLLVMEATVTGEPSRARRLLRTFNGPNVTSQRAAAWQLNREDMIIGYALFFLDVSAHVETVFELVNRCTARYFDILKIQFIYKACRNVYFIYWKDAVRLTFALAIIDSLVAI